MRAVPAKKQYPGPQANIVLIGMPTAGKTTLASLLHEYTGREVVEMDETIAAVLDMSIRECFERYGEGYFRDLETAEAKRLRNAEGKIISCGGGIIKREENMRYLAENGVIFWIDRDPQKLFPTDSRPLSSNQSDLARLYEERKDLYSRYCDYRISNNTTPQEAVMRILEVLNTLHG